MVMDIIEQCNRYFAQFDTLDPRFSQAHNLIIGCKHEIERQRLEIVALETENAKLIDHETLWKKLIADLRETNHNEIQEATRLLHVENEKLLNKIKILEVALGKLTAKATANSMADDILNGNGNTGGIDFADFLKKEGKVMNEVYEKYLEEDAPKQVDSIVKDGNYRELAINLYILWMKALNELLAVEHKLQWQPIETAPKDNKMVLLYRDDPRQQNACWMTIGMHVNTDFIVIGVNGEEVFPNAWVDQSAHKLNFEPTHWMHLPDMPKETE
jgi:hypothetical protein